MAGSTYIKQKGWALGDQMIRDELEEPRWPSIHTLPNRSGGYGPSCHRTGGGCRGHTQSGCLPQSYRPRVSDWLSDGKIYIPRPEYSNGLAAGDDVPQVGPILCTLGHRGLDIAGVGYIVVTRRVAVRGKIITSGIPSAILSNHWGIWVRQGGIAGRRAG